MTTHYEHIIVPIDFSAHSGAAARWAALWQRRTGARVSVLHARQLEAPAFLGRDEMEAVAREDRETRRLAREEAVRFLAQQVGPVDWDIFLEEGDPVQQILAHGDGDHLVIMGTHGRRGARRWMLGSVAEAMVYANRLPVLVVHVPEGAAPAPPALRRILAPDNGSVAGRAGLAAAADIAEAFGAELLALEVREPGQPQAPAPEPPSPIRRITRAGRPAEAILAAAAAEEADLIVLGAGRQRFLHFDVMPATVTQVLRYGNVPVLIVPQQSAGGL